MGDIVEFPKQETGLLYHVDEDDNIIALSHTDWCFSIQAVDGFTALVDNDGNAFGVIDSDAFNQILIAWLGLHCPSIFTGQSSD